MPIFEYACKKCDRVFEELVLRRSDEAAVRCPSCRGQRIERVVSRPARTGGGDAGGRTGPGCGPVG
ncbi:MAG TPA: zinc ribbon domain-containing protein [Anaeromyxobacteraceae bacterium]|nr:zinc ribbon domain-containing protein [Anaeromyxobacteraceae bacterium]